MHLTARFFGFAEKAVSANYFGTSYQADAYNVAYKIPSTIFFGCEKILNPSFIPSFIDLKQREGESAAWRLAGTTLLIQGLLLVGLVALGRALAEPIVRLVAPGFYPGYEGGSWVKVNLTTDLMGIVFLSVVFLGISSTTYCILNSFKRFASPALGDTLWKVGTVVGLIILFRYYGLGIYALAIGFVAGAWLKLGTHLVALGRDLLKIRPTLPLTHPSFKRMVVLMLPMAFGFAYSEFRQLMDIRFASPLSEGAVAALDYSRKLTDLPYQVVAYALGIALFPFLAERASAQKWDELRGILMSALRTLVFLFVPATVAMFVLAEPALRLVYQSGAFNEESLRLTVPALEFYALGMLAQALECVLLQTFYSMRNTLVPTIIGFATSALHIGLAWWFVNVLPTDDPRGLALAYAVARTVKVLIAFPVLGRALGGLPLRPHASFAWRVGVATGLMGMVLHLCLRVMATVYPMAGRKEGLVVFGVCAAAGAVAYLAVAAVLRVPEMQPVLRRLRSLARKS